MKEIQIVSSDGKNQLHVVIWQPEGEIKAIVQLSHGMIEYIERYNDFAEYLNQYSVLVVGSDHLGHGKTAKEDDLGYFGAEKSKTVVDDLYKVTKYTKDKYGYTIPYFLFGHSMGSFMARRYIMTYGEGLTGAIISGTGMQSKAALAIGRLCASIIGSVHDERYRSDFMKKLAFGTYNKRIENPQTENDWLTKDAKVVERYNNDKFCTFKFTINGYQTLFDVLGFIQSKKNINKIPKYLPIFMIAGDADPVGNYGKGVKKVYKTYKRAGIKDIELKLYKGDRHELVNETDKDTVYADVYRFIKKHSCG